MSDEEELERLLAKTPEQKFLHTLVADYRFAPKIAETIVHEAQSCLLGEAQGVRAGQMRVILSRQRAAFGPRLSETAQVEVTWTVDGGAEDLAVRRQGGRRGLRWFRIQRLLDEAIEQGGVASQEDLARALQTSLRTIKRDFAQMQADGVYLPSRGYLQGVGRGQTHKAQIIRRWLQGETYDQLSLNTHHAPTSIQRYIRTFVQVVELHRQGHAERQISYLLQIGLPLVQDYLAVYQQNDTPACRERLEAQLQRFQQAASPQKGAQ